MLNRRKFISYIPAAMISAGTIAVSKSLADEKYIGQKFISGEKYENVSAIETLMRGHGLLMRCWNVYDVFKDGILSNKQIDPKLILKTTSIIKEYLEGYHEQMEEKYIFSQLEKVHNYFPAIQELKMQHGVGFALTDRIISMAKANKLNKELCNYLTSFGQMYRYHSAWEDTILFPAFDALESKSDIADIAATFVLEERKILGTTGFESFVNDIIKVEKELDVYGISKYTPTL